MIRAGDSFGQSSATLSIAFNATSSLRDDGDERTATPPSNG